jgi:hypothetical protein
VTDESGRVWASASRAKVHVWFDMDAMFGEMLSKQEGRRLAEPTSSGTPVVHHYGQLKSIAAWSYKRRQRAEAVA